MEQELIDNIVKHVVNKLREYDNSDKALLLEAISRRILTEADSARLDEYFG